MQHARTLFNNELALFNQKLKAYLKSDIFLLDAVIRYMIKQKGKQIRPLFVFLSAKLNEQPIDESLYRGAACCEILHSATLIHDDIVDEAQKRRHYFSINALWKNKIAVLAGDYLLSKGMLLGLQNKEYAILEILSEAVRLMSQAELLQLEKSRTLNTKESLYFDIIKGKTAALIASACGIGVHTLYQKAPEKWQKMYDLGHCIGQVFQIKDDLLDLSTDPTGKPKTQDIKEQKLTLPLIYALQSCSFSERQRFFFTLKYRAKNKKNIQWILDLCHKKGAIARAEQTMRHMQQQALRLLNDFPPSEYRTAFSDLVDFIVTRTH